MASFSAVKYGYRCLEDDKKAALKEAKGDFEQSLTLSGGSTVELTWWVMNVDSAQNDLEKEILILLLPETLAL